MIQGKVMLFIMRVNKIHLWCSSNKDMMRQFSGSLTTVCVLYKYARQRDPLWTGVFITSGSSTNYLIATTAGREKILKAQVKCHQHITQGPADFMPQRQATYASFYEKSDRERQFATWRGWGGLVNILNGAGETQLSL